MPQGLQTLTFAKLNITGSAFEAVSPISGDSATFFNVPQDSKMYVAELWGCMSGHAAELSVTASRWHDQTYGIRGEITSGATTAPINRAVCLSPIGVGSEGASEVCVLVLQEQNHADPGEVEAVVEQVPDTA